MTKVRTLAGIIVIVYRSYYLIRMILNINKRYFPRNAKYLQILPRYFMTWMGYAMYMHSSFVFSDIHILHKLFLHIKARGITEYRVRHVLSLNLIRL